VAESSRNSVVAPKRATKTPPSASNTMSRPSVTVASAEFASESRVSSTMRGRSVACIGAIGSVASVSTGTTASRSGTLSRPVAAASGMTRTTTPCRTCDPTRTGLRGSRSTTGPARTCSSHGSNSRELATPVRAVEPLNS